MREFTVVNDVPSGRYHWPFAVLIGPWQRAKLYKQTVYGGILTQIGDPALPFTGYKVRQRRQGQGNNKEN